MMRDPEEILEEAKDVIDEITDLESPLPILDQLLEYIATVRTICETLSDETLEVTTEPTQASPGESSSPTNAET
jgi:hypothetical protein